MLSVEHQTVYDIIRAIAVDLDVYKVLEADEILERLPIGIRVSKIQLSSIIRDLKELDYIMVKYFTPDEYCLLVRKLIDDTLKPQAQVVNEAQHQQDRVLYSEQKRELKREQKRVDKEVKTVGLGRVFFMSFLGAFLASGIVATIAAIIIKFV